MDNTPEVSAIAIDNAALFPGAALAAAREAQGLSIEDISRQLKLSVTQIKSIEADDHSRLPSPVFVRGFIRSYARIVKLDVAQLLPPKAAYANAADATEAGISSGQNVDSADVHMLRDTPGVSIEPSPHRKAPVLFAGIACLLLGLAYYEFVLNVPPAPAPAPAIKPVPLPVAAPADAVPELGVPPDTVTPDTAVVPTGGLALKKSDDPVSDTSHSMQFVFNGESWVEVRDGFGKVIFSRTNVAGTEHKVQGNPPFRVVVGNATKVQLTYNGKVIDLAAHATEDVARLQLD